MRIIATLAVIWAIALMPALGQTPPPPGHDEHGAAGACPPGMTCPPGTAQPPASAGMMQRMQDMMIMAQNTAIWTPQGLIVLQGNRLLYYSTDLQLRREVALPAPAMMPMAGQSIRGLLSTRLLSTEDGGVIVIRGRQLIRVDRNYRIAQQAVLPDLPPMTTAETNATCPMCAQMMSAMPTTATLALCPNGEAPIPHAGPGAEAGTATTPGVTGGEIAALPGMACP